MSISRREFLSVLGLASAAGLNLAGIDETRARQTQPGVKAGKLPADIYEVPAYGNVSLLHITDLHAQLLPVYYREPATLVPRLLKQKQPPHINGEDLLKYYAIGADSASAYAFTHLNFTEAARKYGKLGGFAHLATLVKKIRAQRPQSLLLDGGDNWQGSATSLWTQAQDMADASVKLGIDVMTGHWEFTYGSRRMQQLLNTTLRDKIEFVAQNVVDNEFEDAVFKPYVIREINNVPVAIIGQAFPYTPIANPGYMVPHWRFGIREQELQSTVDKLREQGVKLIVLLSHNGLDVDLKLAARVSGLDVIFSGHTHDVLPQPLLIENPAGKTIVVNSGTSGKFLSVMDLDVRAGRVQGFRYHLLPVFSNMIEADAAMQQYIRQMRAPFLTRLQQPLAVTEDLLYRRGVFNGSFDQIIMHALHASQDAELALSPGFRWGGTLLPESTISFEDVMAHTAITYPMVNTNLLSGEQIKLILEDVADNVFNPDPYQRQGGDMVRVSGLHYTITPGNKAGGRISHMTIAGKKLMAHKKYKVAGWGNVSQYLDGIPIWDVVSEYLRDKKHIGINTLNMPELKF